MSGIIPPSSDSAPAPINHFVPVKADAHTAGLAASGDKNAVNSSTKIGSLEELKQQAPEVYRAMMQGLATSMIKRWDRAEERRQRIAKEFERR